VVIEILPRFVKGGEYFMEQKKEIILPTVESGGEGMVNGELWHEIQSRFKLKESKISIARALGLRVQTVRKILRQRS